MSEPCTLSQKTLYFCATEQRKVQATLIKKHLPHIDCIAKKVIEITAIALFVLLILFLIYALLLEQTISATHPSINELSGQIVQYIAIVLLVVFLTAVCVRLVLSPFVKPDEEADFERKVDYVLEHKKRQKEPAPSDVHSPLMNLPPEGEQIVCSLLKALPEHITKPGHINLAQTMHYLTALQQSGYLDDKDLYNLRLWLTDVTGKDVPSTSQFNEAYPSKATTKVAKAKEQIERALSAIR